jgi:pimeloyl-ACP methyl ester carboxylesterase
MSIANVKELPAATAREGYHTNSVASKDGTTISYRELGIGPGVVLVHGAMESAQSHMQLAEALALDFTVYLPDRRGRGMSGPYGDGFGIRTNVEDLDAVLTRTGAHRVFGVSSGAVICLEAALTLPAIHKAAIFEPPLVIDGSVSTDFLTRYDREIAEGNVAGALVTGMIGSQMGPPVLNLMPRWLLERLTKMMMAGEDKKAGRDDVTMRMLAPTLHYDFELVAETDGKLEGYGAIGAEVLLLSGSKSPAYLRGAVDALEKVFPRARRVEFPGLGHGASGNADRAGKPERVAEELRAFFA